MIAEADLLFEDVGLLIQGVLVHEQNGKRWFAFPAFRETRSYGSTNIGSEDVWVQKIKFTDDEKKAEFRKAAKAAVAQFLCGTDSKKGA